MRVYLDSCVIQDLKQEMSSSLLDVIISSKGEFIYCFSEAHLHDLSRDKSVNKFADMGFMERIVDDNCFFYDKKVCFELYSPRDYYDLFEWTDTSTCEFMDSFCNEDEFKSILKSIPFNLSELITKEQLPQEMPSSLVGLLTQPTDLYDFFTAFLNVSDTLSTNQKKFKELLHYLHGTSSEIYNYLNIEGYNGQEVIDKDKFIESYTRHFLKDGKKYRYDLFTDMYSGLEIFGFVKGKPKKQKMMNMIDDARHAFFGGFCDIVVSKDEDFLKKAKFMYDIHEIQTKVFSIPDFENYLTEYIQCPNNRLGDIFSELENEETQNDIIYDINENGQRLLFKRLRGIYWGYFNVQISHSNGSIYFSKETSTFSLGTLIKEIEYCTNKLYIELGSDINSRGEWIRNEMKEDQEWYGRTWIINNEIILELKFTKKLYIIVRLLEKSSPNE